MGRRDTYANIVMAACSGADNTVVRIDHLKKLANHEGYRLDSLHLLLGSQQLALQVLGLILHIFLLHVGNTVQWNILEHHIILASHICTRNRIGSVAYNERAACNIAATISHRD